MKTKWVFALCTVLVLTVVSAAQQSATPAYQGNLIDGVTLPGQTWTSIGNLSPIEHNNVYFQSYIEQSATAFATRGMPSASRGRHLTYLTSSPTLGLTIGYS